MANTTPTVQDVIDLVHNLDRNRLNEAREKGLTDTSPTGVLQRHDRGSIAHSPDRAVVEAVREADPTLGQSDKYVISLAASLSREACDERYSDRERSILRSKWDLLVSTDKK